MGIRLLYSWSKTAKIRNELFLFYILWRQILHCVIDMRCFLSWQACETVWICPAPGGDVSWLGLSVLRRIQCEFFPFKKKDFPRVIRGGLLCSFKRVLKNGSGPSHWSMPELSALVCHWNVVWLANSSAPYEICCKIAIMICACHNRATGQLSTCTSLFCLLVIIESKKSTQISEINCLECLLHTHL